MNLLGARHYDPAVAVSKATTALLAMTALDTTNLRIAFTVPASGLVRVRLAGTLHGATTCPQILLGVLEGSTVRGRSSPMHGGTNIAATSKVKAEADFVVTGLTPGANLTWDAAYGVETVVAATGLKYGGPNNTTANDAFGGFTFEIWDVQVPTPMTAADLRAALGLASANLDTQLAALATLLNGVPTANGIRDAVFARLISTNLSFLQVVQLHAAVALGKSSNGSNGRTFRDIDDTVNAVAATLENLNRTAVTLTPPSAP
jgi:hypothetical protein